MAVCIKFNLTSKLKLILIVCFAILNPNNLFSECNCIQTGNTHQGSPDKFYTFKDSCVVGFCGPVMLINNQPNYYGCCMMDCSDANILNCFEHNEIIKFIFQHDTLKIYTFLKLPNGKNFKQEKNLFEVTYINCINGKVSVHENFNNKLKKYNTTEIKTILNNYNRINCFNSADDFIVFADELLMCYLSGSVEAANLFLNMKDKTIEWIEGFRYIDIRCFDYSAYYDEYLMPKYKKITDYINSTKK